MILLCKPLRNIGQSHCLPGGILGPSSDQRTAIPQMHLGHRVRNSSQGPRPSVTVQPALIDLTGSPQRVVTIADYAAAQLGVRFTSGGTDEVPGNLADVAALVAAETIPLPISRSSPWSAAAVAHRDSESGHVRGKLTLLAN
jgi:hypothetical protein